MGAVSKVFLSVALVGGAEAAERVVDPFERHAASISIDSALRGGDTPTISTVSIDATGNEQKVLTTNILLITSLGSLGGLAYVKLEEL